MRIGKWLVILLLLAGHNITAFCQDGPPLTVEERKEILLRLGELELARQKIANLEAYVTRDKEQDARDKALSDRELAAAQKEVEIAQKERDLARKEFADYKAAYQEVTASGGWKYGLCKFFSLGLSHCR